jgi:hypothetical protein
MLETPMYLKILNLKFKMQKSKLQCKMQNEFSNNSSVGTISRKDSNSNWKILNGHTSNSDDTSEKIWSELHGDMQKMV